MAHADKISRRALASLAGEIGELLDGAGVVETPARPAAKAIKRAGAKAAGKSAAKKSAGAGAESPPAELVETFTVWTLDARALKGGGAAKKAGAKKGAAKAAEKAATEAGAAGGSLRAAARETGRWHHQIKVGGRAAAFARSSGAQLGLDHVSLRGLFVSPLAEKIEEAVGWIDANEPGGRGGARDPVVRLLVVPSHQLHAFWLFDEREGTSEVLVIDAPARLAPAGPRRLLGEGEFLELLRGARPVRGLS